MNSSIQNPKPKTAQHQAPNSSSNTSGSPPNTQHSTLPLSNTSGSPPNTQHPTLNTSSKVALITGITGQDGSYLAEFLLNKGYEVHGIIRRSSSFNTKRIDHLYKDPHERNVNFFLHYGDMTDSTNLIRILQEIQPDEIYNLAAQSHVMVSFETPEYTAETVGVGTLKLLEAIRILNLQKKTKLYQASTSELFGKVQEIPQKETTPFYPRSPYAAAKLYAYWIVINYREAYDIFACNGILFNHECVSENTPVIVRDKNTKIISIKRVKDIKKPRTKVKNIQQWEIKNMDIWDGTKFVSLKLLTVSKRKKDDNFRCKIMNTRNGIVSVTNHHNMIDDMGSKIKAKEIKIGTKLLHGKFPKSANISSLTTDEAIFLGMMVGDGYIGEDGKASFSNNNEEIRKKFEKIWLKVGLGTTSTQEYKTEYGNTIRLVLNGNHNYLKMLRNEIYTFDGYKKVPDRILNADKRVQLAFLEGYNCTDGLQSNACTYKFKNFKTNSNILLQGLLFLTNQITEQSFTLNFEKDEKYYGYYSANLLSPVDNRAKEIEVKKFLYHEDQPNWVYDIETDSGKLMAGVGTMVVSNSPRRGETFVTRKITRAAARIALGLQDKLYLGNLDAKRDWGYAPDYVEVMWLMLQQDKPDDFVIATGETHTVREFCQKAFNVVGINLEFKGKGVNEKGYIKSINKDKLSKSSALIGREVIEIDPRYFRPTDVKFLLGDPTKAKQILGWENRVKFDELVQIMAKHDLMLAEYEIHKKKFNGRR